MDSRLRALCDLDVAEAREYAGRHEYDGRLQDLSPDGVRRGLAALGGERLADPYDEALTAAKEAELRVRFGELAQHRTNPMPHLANLDVACYDRDYAPEARPARGPRAPPARLAGRGGRVDRGARRGARPGGRGGARRRPRPGRRSRPGRE